MSKIYGAIWNHADSHKSAKMLLWTVFSTIYILSDYLQSLMCLDIHVNN